MKRELLTALKVYLVCWLVMAVLFFVLFLRQYFDVKAALQQGWEMLFNGAFQAFQHLFFLSFYLCFLIIRYFVRTFKKRGWRVGLRRLVVRCLLPIGILIFGVRAVIYTNSRETSNYEWDYSIENITGLSKDLYAYDGKHRGMSVFPRNDDYDTAANDLLKDNIEWVAVIPFIYQENEQSKTVRIQDSSRRQRHDSSFVKEIRTLHNKGIRVHFKPHVWLGEGWRSNISLSPSDWGAWFASYRQRMLRYARMAQQEGVELFCVGTELRTAVAADPKAWVELIKEIRGIYSGKLTYAANWDDPIDSVPFWDMMDYIGIQAYFPLTENPSPELETIMAGWDTHIPKLEAAAKMYKKPILFTEVGYRSDVSATIRPWEWGSNFGVLTKKKSDVTQQRAFEALFQKLWDKPWFAGCYVWQWHTGTKAENMTKNVDFTPRFKPAENTLAKWYGTRGATTRSMK